MKLKQIAFAVATTLAAGSSFAAMTQDQIDILDDANLNGRVIFVSGASAVQKGITGIAATLFDDSTVTPFYLGNAADITGSSYLAIAGVLGGSSAWAGQNVIYVERTKGGSVWGVDPVARGTAIESLNVTSGTCGTAGTGTSANAYTCTLTNGTTVAHVVPDAGISDVAPALFKGPYNTEGEVAAPSLTDDELADLAITPIYGLAFGVSVTKNVGMIDLSKADMSNIYAGNVNTWSKIKSTETGNMVVCRRVPGSGTQAVFNMYFGQYPCTTDFNAPASRLSNQAGVWNDATNTYTVGADQTKLVVIENSGSGEVRKCLDAAYDSSTKANDGNYTTYETFDRDGASVTVKFQNGIAHKAVGVLSMDSLSSSKTSAKWQFRSLDGAGTIVQDVNASTAPTTSGTGKFPTFANYENGNWDMQGWISFNLPSRTVGDKADVLAEFVAAAQDPAVLQSVSSLKFVAAGIPGNGYTGVNVLDAKYLNGNQCAPYNRTNAD